MTFGECVIECARTPAFVREFDRLAGTHLSSMGTRQPIEAMVDEATGRDREAMRMFLSFVWEFVYTRIPEEPA